MHIVRQGNRDAEFKFQPEPCSFVVGSRFVYKQQSFKTRHYVREVEFVIMYLAGKVNPLEYPYIALSFDSAFHIVSVPSLRKLSP